MIRVTRFAVPLTASAGAAYRLGCASAGAAYRLGWRRCPPAITQAMPSRTFCYIFRGLTGAPSPYYLGAARTGHFQEFQLCRVARSEEGALPVFQL